MSVNPRVSAAALILLSLAGWGDVRPAQPAAELKLTDGEGRDERNPSPDKRAGEFLRDEVMAVVCCLLKDLRHVFQAFVHDVAGAACGMRRFS